MNTRGSKLYWVLILFVLINICKIEQYWCKGKNCLFSDHLEHNLCEINSIRSGFLKIELSQKPLYDVGFSRRFSKVGFVENYGPILRFCGQENW